MRKSIFLARGALSLIGLIALGGGVAAQSGETNMVPLEDMGTRLAALIRPGNWIGTTQEFDIAGKAKGPAKSDIPACMTQKQAADNFGEIFGALAMMRDMPGCGLTESRIAGGTAKANIKCVIDGKNISMSFNGQFGPDTFEFTMKNEAEGIEAERSGSMRATAKRTGDC